MHFQKVQNIELKQIKVERNIGLRTSFNKTEPGEWVDGGEKAEGEYSTDKKNFGAHFFFLIEKIFPVG